MSNRGAGPGGSQVDTNEAVMWRIEYRVTTGSDSVGRFEREYIENDEDAHLRLMELEIDQTLADTSGLNWPGKRRARAWLRRRPDVPVPDVKDYQHAKHLKAWRLIDGEWREAKWTLIEPSIEVYFDAE